MNDELTIRDLPTEVILRLVEHIDGISYIEFIIAFGSYELFLTTKNSNRERFLRLVKYNMSWNCKEEFNIRRDNFQKHGKWILYYGTTRGKLIISRIGHFRNGQMHGYYAQYNHSTGNVAYETWFQHGETHGRAIDYYDNGAIRKTIEMVHNRKNGTEMHYYINGAIQAIKTYKNNKLLDQSYRAVQNYIDGEKYGEN
jgi:antitoxin component YwqK of YwqJK toxin-antitoxin module